MSHERKYTPKKNGRKKKWQLILGKTAIADTKNQTEKEDLNSDGVIESYVVDFPTSSNSNLELKIFLDKTQIVPKGGNVGLRLTYGLERFHLNKEFKQGQELKISLDNNHATNDYDFNIIFECSEK